MAEPMDLEAAIRAYQDGMALADAAAIAGVNYKRFRRHLAEAGVLRSKTNQALRPDEIAVICELFDAGNSIPDIARKVNRSASSVSRYVRESGRTPPTLSEAMRRYSDKQIAEWADLYRQGFSVGMIAEHANKLGIRISDSNLGGLIRKYTDVEIRPAGTRAPVLRITGSEVEGWVRRYEEGETVAEIAATTTWTEGAVYNRLVAAGVNTNRTYSGKRVIPLGDDILTDEWAVTEAGAWWIGMFATDGNITTAKAGENNPSPEVRILLKEEDADGVLCCARALGHGDDLIQWEKNSKYSDYYSAYIRFRHPKFQYLIDRCGLLPRKSGTVSTPDFLLDNRHYWRGIVDGDGFVTISKKDNYPYVGLKNDSVALLEQFAAFCEGNGIHAKVYGVNTVRVWGDHASRLAELLWRDCNFTIRRKWAKAHRIMGLKKPLPTRK